jgi:hypothetical protein
VKILDGATHHQTLCQVLGLGRAYFFEHFHVC